jgi:hypothetical protein
MIFILEERLVSQARPHTTWLEPGEYDVQRYFDNKRIIIDVTAPTSTKRQITIVPISAGTISYEPSKNQEENKHNYLPA